MLNELYNIFFLVSNQNKSYNSYYRILILHGLLGNLLKLLAFFSFLCGGEMPFILILIKMYFQNFKLRGCWYKKIDDLS